MRRSGRSGTLTGKPAAAGPRLTPHQRGAGEPIFFGWARQRPHEKIGGTAHPRRTANPACQTRQTQERNRDFKPHRGNPASGFVTRMGGDGPKAWLRELGRGTCGTRGRRLSEESPGPARREALGGMRRNPLLFFLSGQNLAGPPGTGWSPQTSPVPDVLGRHGIDHLD